MTSAMAGLNQSDIEEAARAVARQNRAPWYVEMFLAFGGWISGLFGAIAIFALIAALSIDDISSDGFAFTAFFFGALLAAGGVPLGRKRQGDFTRHFAIASIAAGLSAATAGLWRLFYSGLDANGGNQFEANFGLAGLATGAVFAAAAIAIARAVDDGILTFLTTLAFFAIMALATGVASDASVLAASGFWLLPALASLAGLILFTRPVGRRVHAAAGAALMIGPTALYEITRYGQAVGFAAPPRLVHYAAEGLFMLGVIYALWSMRARYPLRALAIAGAVLLAGVWFLPFAGAAAILIVCAGFAANHRGLAGVGVVALAWFISRFYYDLSMTLLEKSALLAGLGAATLAGAFSLSRLGKEKETRPTREGGAGDKKRRPIFLTLAFGAVLVLSLGLINRSVYELETAFSQARAIYLPLGPVDPRSLIQGDYMRLAFRESLYPSAEEIVAMPKEGEVFLKLDADNVASFSRVAKPGDAAAEDEIRIDYRKTSFGSLRYAPDSFFFQEGEAEAFGAARFAVILVAEDGRTRLVALADEHRVIIDPLSN